MAIDVSSPGVQNQQDSALKTVGKYFLHGATYSLLMTGFVIVWAFVLLFLVLIGSIIGLVLGGLIIIMGVGWANKTIAGYIWGITAKGAWTSLLGHGLLLLTGLIIVQIPWSFINTFFSSSSLQVYAVYTVVQFLLMAVIDGVLGKRVASMFEEASVASTPPHYLRRLPSV
ncbi:MAG: hypothetical protein C4K49_08590 [Candidatus Thorarchaeota archaeon]|nr:MAG: hypothetical protein C4K49_08590 [Candidatus Thorarchaeota archaeon]